MIDNITGFDWDEGNSFKNKIKHDVETWEAEEVFLNEPLLLSEDEKHSQDEDRYHALGKTNKGRRLLIAFTIRDQQIRVISARPMDKDERSKYEKAT